MSLTLAVLNVCLAAWNVSPRLLLPRSYWTPRERERQPAGTDNACGTGCRADGKLSDRRNDDPCRVGRLNSAEEQI